MYSCQNTTLTDYAILALEVILFAFVLFIVVTVTKKIIQSGVNHVLDWLHRITRRTERLGDH